MTAEARKKKLNELKESIEKSIKNVQELYDDISNPTLGTVNVSLELVKLELKKIEE